MQENRPKITYTPGSDILDVLLTEQLYYVRYVTETIHECRTIQHNDVCGWRVFAIQKAIADGKKPIPKDFVEKMAAMDVSQLLRYMNANPYVPITVFYADRNQLCVLTEDVPKFGSYINESLILFKKEPGEVIGFELKLDGIVNHAA